MGDQRCGVTIPKADIALNNTTTIVFSRAVITATVPFVLQTLRQFINVVDLVDRHACIHAMQHSYAHRDHVDRGGFA